ncbi:MAG: hypothetical protein E6342_18030 [Clostridium sp.]|uniref:hypothetical protein n=1 Tax=Clostridium sp. TaxID=1506 RepID=UPI001F42FE19|nr:hypothetical protein [Clostridium sp.]MDU7089587.1 hypothetical protein [Clostridium sp.]
MKLVILTSFLLMVFGFFNVFEISLTHTINDIFTFFENKKHDSLGKKIKLANNPKKDRFLIALLKETKELLEHTNKKDKFLNVCICALVSMLVGIYISLSINNYFLIPVLAIGFLTLPFQYVKIASVEYKKSISKELEVCLSIITTSYIRNENIVEAVRENIDQIKPPIKIIFDEFLLEVKYVNSDISKSLLKLKDKIDDDIFDEWIDALVICQENIALKNNLSVIVSKLSSLRILSAEINNNMYAPIKEFITMLLFVYGNIPLLYFLNKDWYKTLIDTIPGKLVLVVVILVTFISFTGIMKLTKPIEPSILEERKS